MIPIPWLIANTLVVEVALLVAVYWLIVRRAEKRRRATAVFALATLALVVLEALVGYDELGPRKFGDRWIKHWEGPRFLLVHFHWEETPLLGRRVKREILLIDAGSRTTAVTDPVLFEDLWPYHTAKQTSETGRALWRRTGLP